MPTRLGAAVLTFAAIIGLADLLGNSHGYLGLLSLVAAFFALQRLGPAGWRRLLAAMLALSVAIAALAVIQTHYMPRSRGPFVSANFLAGYAVLHVFLALHVWGRTGRPLLAGAAILANGLALALSQGRGGILAFGAGMVAYLGRGRPRLAAVAGCAMLAIAIAVSLGRGEGATDPRFGIWRLALQAASQKLLLGWGQEGVLIGTLRPAGSDIVFGGVAVFYNVALEWLLAGGILGLAAGIWIIVEGLLAARRQPALLAFLVAWLADGMFIFTTPGTSIPLFVVLAYLASERRQIVDVAAARVDDL